MKKFWNFGEPEGPNELRLDGPISEESWFGDEVTPAAFRADLAAHPGDITVWINSPGGDVFAASSIYTALKEHKGKVTVKIEALAASAASIVAMAGDEIHMAPTAYMMIHRAATVAIGDTDEMKKAGKTLDEADEGIAQLYADRTGQALDKIRAMMKAETWMNAQTAFSLGFADSVLYQGEREEPKGEPEPAPEPERDKPTPEQPKDSARERLTLRMKLMRDNARRI